MDHYVDLQVLSSGLACCHVLYFCWIVTADSWQAPLHAIVFICLPPLCTKAVMHESKWLLLLNAGLLLCGAGLEVFYLCRCCCFRRLGQETCGIYGLCAQHLGMVCNKCEV